MKAKHLLHITTLFLFLTSLGKVALAQALRIDAEHFPDEAFRNYVGQHFDLNGNGRLEEFEIRQVKEIRVDSMGIDLLTGVEHFTALETLSCAKNHLKRLDVRQNNRLRELYCSKNQLGKSLPTPFNQNQNTFDTLPGETPEGYLDLSQNPELRVLHCEGNRLPGHDLSHNPELVEIKCNGYSVDVTHNPKLERLSYIGSASRMHPLWQRELDLSHNPELRELVFCNYMLETIDLSHNPKLTRIVLNNTYGIGSFSRLDLSHNPELEELSCMGNKNLKELILTHNPKLRKLDCRRCPISSLDLSQNPELEELYHDVEHLNLEANRKLKVVEESDFWGKCTL